MRELKAWPKGAGGFNFYQGDIADEKFLKSVFDLERPSYVCHLAARAGVRASLDDPRYVPTVTVRMLQENDRSAPKKYRGLMWELWIHV